MNTTRKAVLLAIASILLASALFGQITGSLRGVVIDSSGAAIPGATVTLTSLETGEVRQMRTDPEGNFAFHLLRIGFYEIKAEAGGFRTGVTQAEVRTGEVAGVQMRLEVGQVTESITVTDAVALLDTENAQIQRAVTGPAIQEFPVARNPNLFATMAPGVVPVTANNPFLGSGSYNTNGGRGRGNNITVDNITTTDISVTGTGGVLNVLNFSDLREVKLISNNFSAEYGRNSSSQLIYNLKSGTNEFHGEVFHFFRNDKLNSRPYFDRTGKANIVRWNEWGYSVGGPVYLPRLFDGRNKLFWLSSYEGIKERGAGASRIANVPTAAMLAQVTDPTSKAILEMYKLPAATSTGANAGQVEQSAATTTDLYKLNYKIDWNASSQDTVSGRYARAHLTGGSSGLTFIGSNLANFGALNEGVPQQASLAWTHLFSPTVVHEARFGFGRSTAAFPINSTAPLGPRIIFNNGQVDAFGVWEGLPQGRIQNTFQYTDTLTWVRGAHNFKWGADVYRYQGNSFFDAQVRGVFRFNNWDDFAAGKPFQHTQRFGSSVRGHRVTNHHYFFQDDWKATRNLTLNLGLRIEVAHGVSEVNGLISNLNLDCRQPMGAAGTGPYGCMEVGKPSFGTNVNWGPRFGFAYAIGANRRTVLRGGYGIAYDFIFLNPVTNQRFLPPFIVTGNLVGIESFTGANSFAAVFAGKSQYQAETAAQVGKFDPNTRNFGSVSPAIAYDLRNPQVHQFHLGIQRELFRDLVVKLGYVGTKGNYLQRTRSLNLLAAPPQPATSLADETARLNEFRTAISASSGTPTRPSNRTDPRFNEINYLDSSANSNYHSFQMDVQKRFSSGYMLMAAYTYGKSIDDVSDALGVLINDAPDQQNPLDNRDNRAPSQFDIRQRLVITHNWQLPFGKGIGHGWLRRLVAGWGFSGISSFRSGFPVTFQAGPRRGVSPIPVNGIAAAATVRPNASGPFVFEPKPAGSAAAPSTLNSDPVQRISAYAESLGLSQPLLGNFGTLGRNVARLNGQVNFDWQVYKDTAIREQLKFQIGAEFYNIFNNTSFQEVNRNISNPNFGQYTTVATDARWIQLRARLVW